MWAIGFLAAFLFGNGLYFSIMNNRPFDYFGRIIDEKSEQPVIGAKIQYIGKNNKLLYDVTGNEGKFSIQLSRDYQIAKIFITKEGYEIKALETIEPEIKLTPKLITYTITFHSMGGNEIPSINYSEEKEVSFLNPVREGFTFAGWYSNSQYKGSKFINLPKGNSGDKDFFARWIEKNQPSPTNNLTRTESPQTEKDKSSLALSDTPIDSISEGESLANETKLNFVSGYLYLRSKKYEEAIESFKLVLDYKDEFPDVSDYLAISYNNLGFSYEENLNYKKAIECYQYAIYYNPKNSAYYWNLATAYASSGDKTKEIDFLKKAAQLGYDPAKRLLIKKGIPW